MLWHVLDHMMVDESEISAIDGESEREVKLVLQDVMRQTLWQLSALCMAMKLLWSRKVHFERYRFADLELTLSISRHSLYVSMILLNK